MFIENKYTKWYFSLCTTRNNTNKKLCETHHIIPKSLGGGNESSNLVSLTFREHFIAHKLLTKMVDHNSRSYWKLVKAYIMMGVSNHKMYRYVPSRFYAEQKRLYKANWQANHPTRGKKMIKMYNSTTNTCTQVVATNLDKILSLEASGFIRNTFRPSSQETKIKQSTVRSGRVYSQEHRRSISESRQGKPHPINSDKMRSKEFRELRSHNSKRYREQSSKYQFVLLFANGEMICVPTMVAASVYCNTTPNAIRQVFRRRSHKMISNTTPLTINGVTITWNQLDIT